MDNRNSEEKKTFAVCAKGSSDVHWFAAENLWQCVLSAYASDYIPILVFVENERTPDLLRLILYTPDGELACLSVHRLTSVVAVTLEKKGYRYSYNISHTEDLHKNVITLLNDIGVDAPALAKYVSNWYNAGSG